MEYGSQCEGGRHKRADLMEGGASKCLRLNNGYEVFDSLWDLVSIQACIQGVHCTQREEVALEPG